MFFRYRVQLCLCLYSYRVQLCLHSYRVQLCLHSYRVQLCLYSYRVQLCLYSYRVQLCLYSYRVQLRLEPSYVLLYAQRGRVVCVCARARARAAELKHVIYSPPRRRTKHVAYPPQNLSMSLILLQHRGFRIAKASMLSELKHVRTLALCASQD